MDEAEFRRRLEAKAFLEYASVFGHWYGTLRAPVEEALAAGRTVLLEIDVQGAIQVHALFPQAMGVFVLPPSEADLLARLRARGRDSEAVIERRFAAAKTEIAQAKFCGVYDLMVVNNDNGVSATVETIKQAIECFASAGRN